MDFEDTPDEAAFRAKARAFLDANAERRKPGAVEGYRRGQDAPGEDIAGQADCQQPARQRRTAVDRQAMLHPHRRPVGVPVRRDQVDSPDAIARRGER